jgi:hypothetical protein
MPEEDLKNCLRYVFALIGIRGKNLPVEHEKQFLHEYIRKNYGGHTAAEVRLAFDMAVGGKLGVEANCYENFSPLYFAGIMNAFRRWSREAYNRLERVAMLPPPLTDEQKAQIDREYADAKLSAAWRYFQTINKLPVKL